MTFFPVFFFFCANLAITRTISFQTFIFPKIIEPYERYNVLSEKNQLFRKLFGPIKKKVGDY